MSDTLEGPQPSPSSEIDQKEAKQRAQKLEGSVRETISNPARLVDLLDSTLENGPIQVQAELVGYAELLEMMRDKTPSILPRLKRAAAKETFQLNYLRQLARDLAEGTAVDVDVVKDSSRKGEGLPDYILMPLFKTPTPKSTT